MAGPFDITTDTLRLMQGDCLERMAEIPDGSVDLVLTDPPYGTTACKWDAVIPFDEMWAHLRRIAKPNAAIVMTASQPFTTRLVQSNIRAFKYEWIWQKTRSTGFLQAAFMPMKSHENVLVFVESGVPLYNGQKTTGHTPTNSARGDGHSPTFGASKERVYNGGDTTRHPKTVLLFKNERGFHPTQKPVALMEYLIKTYTNEGETALDFTMGSGTTGVAAVQTGRNFIGIEQDTTHYATALGRILSAEIVK